MDFKYYFYKLLDKIISPVPEKLIRSTVRFVRKGLEPYKSVIFNKEMAKRAGYKLNNFLALAEDIPILTTNELYIHNDFYYNALILKKFAGINEDDYIRAAMEHAPYIADDYFWQCDVDAPFNSIIVSSNYRKEVLSKVCDKDVLVVGPYLAYTEGLLSKQEIEKERKRLGRNLLVFPMHSTHWIDVDYNIDNFITKIKALGKDFDSIRICMYWKDIQRGSYKPYQKAGFEIVCAGHIYEQNFIPRLKSIIQIADFTMSNQVGSQVGFSVYLNKPHYLIEDEFEHTDHLEALKSDTADRKIKGENGKNMEAIYSAFSVFSDTITDSQREIVDKFWGISEIKAKDDLRELLLNMKENEHLDNKLVKGIPNG